MTEQPISQAALEALYDQHGGHFNKVDLEGLSYESIRALRSYFKEHLHERLNSLSLEEAIELAKPYGTTYYYQIQEKAQKQRLEELVNELAQLKTSYIYHDLYPGGNGFDWKFVPILKELAKGYTNPYGNDTRPFRVSLPKELNELYSICEKEIPKLLDNIGKKETITSTLRSLSHAKEGEEELPDRTKWNNFYAAYQREKKSLDQIVGLSRLCKNAHHEKILEKLQTFEMDWAVALYKNDELWEEWKKKNYEISRDSSVFIDEVLPHIAELSGKLKEISVVYNPFTATGHYSKIKVPEDLKRWIDKVENKIFAEDGRLLPGIMGISGTVLMAAGAYTFCAGEASIFSAVSVTGGLVLDLYAYLFLQTGIVSEYKKSIVENIKELKKAGVI